MHEEFVHNNLISSPKETKIETFSLECCSNIWYWDVGMKRRNKYYALNEHDDALYFHIWKFLPLPDKDEEGRSGRSD